MSLCSTCCMNMGIVSNLPEYGKCLCIFCYFKLIHSVRHCIELFKMEYKYRRIRYPKLP